MEYEEVKRKFDDLVSSLRQGKPNDRSDMDRYWAIVITDVEKSSAVFATYCTPTQVADEGASPNGAS